MKRFCLIIMFMLVALLLAPITVRGVELVWTQNSDVDFNLGTKSYVLVENGVSLSAFPERGFETVTGWTYAESEGGTELSGEQSTDTDTGWPTEGSNSYKLIGDTPALARIDLNEYAEVQQSVDLTYINTIYFDWWLETTTGGLFQARAFVDGTAVGTAIDVPETAANYIDQSADVSGYSSIRVVSFRITSTAADQNDDFTCYVDNVRGYYPSGDLISSTHDTTYNNADFLTISWTATVPASTTLQFQVATNKDNATWILLGPDGTADTYYTTSGSNIWVGHDGDRYIKYKAYLSTTDDTVTPTLSSVSINYDEITWASYKENYGSLGGTACDTFQDFATEHTVYMEGTGFTNAASYKVIYWYYDVTWYKRYTDTGVVAAADSTLQNSYTFVDTDVEGNWQASVYYPDTYNPSDYLATDENLVANDISYLSQYSFYVYASAIPEFPTVMAAIGVAGLCFGIYYWMRRKRLKLQMQRVN